MAKGGAWDTKRYGDTINEWVVCILLECILTTRKQSLQRLCFYRCLSVHGGACMVAGGGVVARGGACMVAGGACVVARGVCMVAGGCAWLPGACMVAGGVRGKGGHVWRRGRAW